MEEGFQNSGVSLGDKTYMSKEEPQVLETQEIHVRKYGDAREKTTVGFEKANWVVAYANKVSRWNRYHKGEEVPFSVSLEYFKAYGPGTYLFFVFLWEISILFFIMTLISLIPTIYNYLSGTGYNDISDSLQLYLAKFTVGVHRGIIPSVATDADIAESSKHKLINAIPELINAILFFIFYLYWDRKSKRLTEEIKQQIKLPNYTTVEIVNFPKEATDKEIEEYMGRFGKLKEVAPVRNYQEMIFYSKKIFELSLRFKELHITTEPAQQPTEKMTEIEKQIDELYSELSKAEKNQAADVIKYYVAYETPAIREEVVALFKPHLDFCKCCRDQPEEKMFIHGQICDVVPCEEQPGGIIWENVHITWKTRWIRYLIQMVVLTTILVGGFLLISFLNITTPPLSNDTLDTSAYTETTILGVSDPRILESWCLKNSYTSMATTAKCQTYISQYYSKLGITVAISLVAVIIKFLMRLVVLFLARFQRYKTHTQQSSDMIFNLFVMYTVTTVIIIFLFQANIFNLSFKSLLRPLLSSEYLKQNLGLLTDYNDFSPSWYIDIGYQICLTWIFVALSPHTFYPIIHWLLEKMGEYSGGKAVLQKDMESKIEAEQFQIEDHYANVLMIIFVCMMFCSGIPLMIPISFVALITRYIYFKYSFIRYCRVPKTFNESINTRVVQILPLCVFVNLAFCLWIYGSRQVFSQSSNWLSVLIDSGTTGELIRSIGMVLRRAGATWYVAIVLVACMIIVIFKTFLVDVISNYCCAGDQTVPKSVLDDDSMIRSERSLTTSYKLENNPDYFEILAIMNPKTVNNIML